MKYIKFAMWVIVVGTINGINWLWCKVAGKHYEEFGGPQ